MNHKRGRPKASRAGCLMCKPNKLGQGMENELGFRGFANLRREAHSKEEMRPRARRDTIPTQWDKSRCDWL